MEEAEDMQFKQHDLGGFRKGKTRHHASQHANRLGQPRGIRVTQELLRNPSCLGSYRLKFTVKVLLVIVSAARAWMLYQYEG